MKKRNYKIYGNILLTSLSTQRYAVLLDIGFGHIILPGTLDVKKVNMNSLKNAKTSEE